MPVKQKSCFLNVLILDTEYRVTMKRLVLGINVETFDGKVPDRVGTWKSTQEFQKLSEEKLGFSSVSFRRNATEAEVRADFQCLKEQLCEDYGSDRFVILVLKSKKSKTRPLIRNWYGDDFCFEPRARSKLPGMHRFMKESQIF